MWGSAQVSEFLEIPHFMLNSILFGKVCVSVQIFCITEIIRPYLFPFSLGLKPKQSQIGNFLFLETGSSIFCHLCSIRKSVCSYSCGSAHKKVQTLLAHIYRPSSFVGEMINGWKNLTYRPTLTRKNYNKNHK